MSALWLSVCLSARPEVEEPPQWTVDSGLREMAPSWWSRGPWFSLLRTAEGWRRVGTSWPCPPLWSGMFFCCCWAVILRGVSHEPSHHHPPRSHTNTTSIWWNQHPQHWGLPNPVISTKGTFRATSCGTTLACRQQKCADTQARTSTVHFSTVRIVLSTATITKEFVFVIGAAFKAWLPPHSATLTLCYRLALVSL